MVRPRAWVRRLPGWYDNWGRLVCLEATWPYIPGNAKPLAAGPSSAGAGNLVVDIAAVDTGADRTGAGRTVAAVDHTRVGHIAAVGTVAGHTVVVVDRMQVDHTAVAVGIAAAAPGNNQVDRIVLDTAAAEGDMVLLA